MTDLSKQIEDCDCGSCKDCTIIELRKVNFILTEQLAEARSEAVQKFLHASPGWLALEEARDKLLKERQILRDEVEYFVARVEGRHPDGKISSFKTYNRFKEALAKTGYK